MRKILEKLAKGKITVEDAEKALKISFVENLSTVAKLDVGRENRRNVPEIIFAEGKNNEDLLKICERMLKATGRVNHNPTQPTTNARDREAIQSIRSAEATTRDVDRVEEKRLPRT